MAGGKFEKGHSVSKGKGRPKGSKDKVTTEARSMFNDLFNANIGKIQGWLDRVAKDDPAKALDLFFKLSEYVVPKAKIEIDMTDKTIRVEPKNAD